MNSNVNVEFVIVGEYFDPDIFTRTLNLEPNDFWIKGDSVKNRNIVRKDSCWSIETGYYESLDISDQINLMINTITGKKELIKKLKHEFKVKYLFLIIVNIEDDVKPVISFGTEIIEFANYIGATIEVAYYIY